MRCASAVRSDWRAVSKQNRVTLEVVPDPELFGSGEWSVPGPMSWTWTVPLQVTGVVVQCWGAGGGTVTSVTSSVTGCMQYITNVYWS